MPEEPKKIYEIHFVTNYKKDGEMKDYLNKIGFKDFKVDFQNPYCVVYDISLDDPSDSFVEMVNHCGLKDLRFLKYGKEVHKIP
jgi:hypothetical protein